MKRKTLARAVGAAAMALGATQAMATGFQLNEQSGSGLGNAFAGGAAATDDVSAMWWNPAALSQFPRMQGAAVINVITPSIKFNNNASLPATSQPLGNDGGDAGGYNFVPNIYLSVPINNAWTFGLGVNVPFGLTTEYDDGWIGRYQALKSEIKTLNINPAIAWKVTPTLSLGAGINYQQIDATLTNNVNYSGALLQAAIANGVAPGSPTFNGIAAATPGLNSKATIDGNDWGWGWNIGLAWDATPQLRLGASYRSEIKYKVQGNINFENPTVSVAPGNPLAPTIALLSAGVNSQALYGRSVSSDITVPEMANLSVLFHLNSQWDLMGDLQYTGWSSIPELRFNSSSPPQLPAVPLNWDDTWKIALGATYKASDQWKIRFGGAFDQTPVTNDPTARLPDSDRWWATVGSEYRWTPNWKFDVGFAYIFADSPSFNQNQGSTASNALINGTFDANVWILSLQTTYTF